jgi:hypothetical protein
MVYLDLFLEFVLFLAIFMVILEGSEPVISDLILSTISRTTLNVLREREIRSEIGGERDNGRER